MSSTLEFFVTSWGDIAGAIGSRDRRLFGRILKTTEPHFDELYEPEDFDDGPDFERGLERWILGELGKGTADSPSTVVNLGDALGFVAMVRYYGRMVGTLNHSITAGSLFRDDFLLGAAQDAIRPPYSFELLLSRQILGFESDDFPYWGGLARAELTPLRPVMRADAPTWDNDDDIDQWFADLWDVLAAAADDGRDLVTIYS